MLPSLSIIVPIYNVEKYLDQCLQSITNQSKKDIEIICINDGSTDSSLEILQKYANLDKRIVVLDKQNEWLGKTYNDGLDRARGKYIGFVEPDDYIATTMYEKLFQKIEESGTDVVRCDYYEVHHDTSLEISRWSFLSKKIFTQYPISPLDYPDLILWHHAIWTCLYRRETLQKKNIRFMKTPWASFQDGPFWFQILMSIEKMSFILEPLYFYRVHDDQSVRKAKAYFWRDVYKHIDITLSKIHQENDVKYTIWVFLRLRLSICWYNWGLSCLDKKNQQELNTYIQRDYWDGKYDHIAHKLPFREKILYFMLKYRMSYLLSLILRVKIFLLGR